MPTRSSKGGAKSPAAKKTSKKKIKRDAPPAPTAGSDPPIIVDGGSVTISSMFPFNPTTSPHPGYPYAYRIDVDIDSMDWNGQNNKKDKTRGGKDFNLKLYK